MHIALRNSVNFIGGHLLEHITFEKTYFVKQMSYRTGYLIENDKDKEVWISKSCLRRYFKEIN